MYARKTWREKMNNPNLPKVVEIPPRMQKRHGEGAMVLPTPRDVEALIRKLRKGELATVGQLRERLAKQYGVQTACPLVTGIFVRIASEVAEEDAAAGKKRVTPYWRVLCDDGSLNPKFPGGVERQCERLRDEGHRIVERAGKKPRVAGFGGRMRGALS